MFKNLKIGTQIIIVSFLLVLVSVVCTSIAAMRYFNGYMRASAYEETVRAADGFERTLSDKMIQTRAFRDKLAEMTELALLMSERNSKGIYNLTKPLMDASGTDILVIAAADGLVLARPHDKERIGDNIGNDADVKNAFRGNAYEMFMTATSTKLGYYCGTPVRYNGEIVGMLRTAMSLENQDLVDKVKALFGTEATVFADKTRINTTLRENGRRVVGTDASQSVVDKVLQKGEDYSDTLEIFGIPYLAHYSPIKDPGSGKIVGMLFTGKSLSSMYQAITSSMKAVGSISLAVLAFASAVSFWLAGRISKPLERIVHLTERGRGGDLTITSEDFDYEGRNELGSLVMSLSSMISSQRGSLWQVVNTSDSITENTGMLTALSRDNSDAMIQTKSLIDEVSRLCDANAEAVERGSRNILEMAHGANSVAKMSIDGADSLAKTTKISKEAVLTVNDLVSHISIVDERTLENQRKIRELSGSVSEISNFMDVIASIADQTNLLALNAAIEAARAGEAGRGFAVVADEVRKLAEESRNASKSVEALVSALSHNAGDAISATEDSVEIVKQIMSTANVAVTGLNSALAEITSTNESIQGIAAIAQEQAASSAEITNAMEAINRSTEQISRKMSDLHGLSERASSIGDSVSVSAENMSGSVEEMKKRLSHFKMGSQPALDEAY
ncbi:MAG: methyl-accepting chemotaxis protein [Synergistaceae bacterium]|nr:methyl-accepting chemotaxis protein [Synergistaceae bacterium]